MGNNVKEFQGSLPIISDVELNTEGISVNG